jgi:hypothetical protein
MVNYPVLKAFVIDLVTTVITLVVTFLTIPDNVAKLGFSDFIVPIIVALAGAGLVALRRYNIIKSS